jgi:ribose transport system substrate-binding protein
VNDCCALGALRAVREAGHERRAAIMGQNFSPDPLIETEIRKNDSPLIGSVAYFPERYGSKIVPLALKWLNKEQIPPAVHTDHVLVTRENVDEFCAERDLASNRANGPSSVPDGPT